MKILLVEGSKFLRLATERSLVGAGYQVTTAIDGDQALQMAREQLPDLILLDMLLPKVTEPDVLHALKKDARTAEMVCTGLSQKNAERLQADGALAFLEKAELGLDHGPEALLAALKEIVKQIPAKRPPPENDQRATSPYRAGAQSKAYLDRQGCRQMSRHSSFPSLILDENKSLTGGNSERSCGVYGEWSLVPAGLAGQYSGRNGVENPIIGGTPGYGGGNHLG